jgi:hypothetical protein
MSHSLHRGVRDAKFFYISFGLIIVLAAGIVLIPGAPLGLITTSVQALAGVLLPSATVFLLLLCNDREVLGPWVNRSWLNAVATVIVSVLLVLSLILMTTTVFPGIDVTLLALVLGSILVVVLAGGGLAVLVGRPSQPMPPVPEGPVTPPEAPRRETWRMPPLALLGRPVWSRGRRAAMLAMWVYLALAVVMLLVKTVQLGIGH